MDVERPSSGGAGASGTGAGDEPVVGPTPPLAAPADRPPPDAPRRPPFRRLVIGLVAVVAVAGAVVGAAVATSGNKDPFSPGPGSATITWTSAPGAGDVSDHPGRQTPQPFGGTINGSAVSGVSTVDLSALFGDPFRSPSALRSRIRFFEFKGRFDGQSFDLGLYVQYQQHPTVFPELDIAGSHGHRRVQAELAPPASALSNPQSIGRSTPLLFHGTIGNLKVSGRVMEPIEHHGAKNSARATFTVSR